MVKRDSNGRFVKGSQYWLDRKRPHTEQAKEKISLALKGRLPSNFFSSIYQCWLGRARKGLHSIETRRILSDMNKGEKSHLWRGGVTPLNMKVRESLEYRLWRSAVLERDNYTCKCCGVRGGRLNADHIKPFSLYPELRFDVDNGRTLCEDCHKATPSYLNRWYKA